MAFINGMTLTSVKPVCKKDCPDRSADCHCHCEKYKEYRAECDTEMKERFARRKQECDLKNADYEAIKRLPGKRSF